MMTVVCMLNAKELLLQVGRQTADVALKPYMALRLKLRLRGTAEGTQARPAAITHHIT